MSGGSARTDQVYYDRYITTAHGGAKERGIGDETILNLDNLDLESDNLESDNLESGI